MNWIGIIVGAVCGALGGLLTSAVIGKRSTGAIGKIASITVFFVLFTLARAYVSPILYQHYNAYTLEDDLLKMPLWVAMKTYEPITYNRMIDDAKTEVLAGEPVNKINDDLSVIIQELVLKRVPTTSNAAALAYMKVMMEEVRVLIDRGDDACYRFLMPTGPAGHSGLLKMLPKDLARRDMETLAEVFRAAYVEPRPIPTEPEFVEAFEPAIIALKARSPRLAEDLVLLGKQQTVLKDQRYVCEVTAAIYEEVFKLPRDDSGMTLRYLIANAP